MGFNNNPFMSKALRKAIMHRSKLKTICNKYRTENNWSNYKKQRNVRVCPFARPRLKTFKN